MDYVIIFASLFSAGFLLVFFLIRRLKNRVFLTRGMNLSLFLVTIPQTTEEEKVLPLEEYLKTVGQFYSSLVAFRERSALKQLLEGNPYFVFEIAEHRIGEQIYFYVACPRTLSGMMEKQILAFWPKAQVQPALDYNIFNPTGASCGSRANLFRSPVLPLKSCKEFGTDPLSAMTSVFTKLAKEDEGAAIQILIRPSRRSIKKLAQVVIEHLLAGKTIENAIIDAEAKSGVGGVVREIAGDISGIFLPAPAPQKTGAEQPISPEISGRISSAEKTFLPPITDKAGQALFDANIRILTSAQSESRAKQILQELESAFEQFNSPVLNQIRFKELSGGQLKKLFYQFSFRIFGESEIMLLSSPELAGIFHFPPPTLLTPHIKWLKARQAPPPANLPEEGAIIGKNIFRGDERVVRISKDDRRRHFYVIGQTGTGKSVLLQEMIKQDMENGEGVALIDPHGDLAEKILGLIPASRAEDVIYFNPGDSERPLGLNMLEYDQKFPESKTFVVNELIEIFEKLYNLKALGFGGPVFEQYMRNALLLIMEDPESGNTLLEVPKVLADAAFRKFKLLRCKNIVVKNFWELEAEKAGGEAALANMVPYITSKMNIFIANDLVRPIIAQQKSSFNLREIMDGGKILIINLSKGKLGDINSYLLGMIIVGKILISAFSRADVPEEERRDFYLYIDEFHNVTTKTISGVLAEARKYKLNMIFSHQFIGQLDEETRKAIFGNVGSMLTFRTGPDDAKYLITQFGPTFDENDLVNFDNYNAGLRLLIRGETSKPFNIVSFPPTVGNSETARLIKKLSRAKYGRNRSQVEAELYQRLKIH